VITLCVVNLKHEVFDLRIDRRTRWGNKYKIGKDGTRDQVIERFRLSLNVESSGIVHEFRRACVYMSSEHLGVVRLGCHCAPEPCHGDVWIEILCARWPDLFQPEPK